MAYYQHIWLLAPDGVDGLCGQPVGVGYFSPTGQLQAWPSHGDHSDASILTDGSDTTRAEFLSDINADNPDFFGDVVLDVNDLEAGTVTPPATAEFVVYYKADRDHRIFLRPDPNLPRLVTADAVVDTTTTDPCPLGAGWRKARLTFASGYGHTNITSLFEASPANTWRVEVTPPQSPSATYHLEFESWVSEIAIGYATLVRTEAHCQNFPRDDRLGVGAAHNYPPPKSRQGGARNFGYY